MQLAGVADGATKVQQFFKITLPMVSPTLFVVMIMRLMASLKVYDLIYMMVDTANPAFAVPGRKSVRGPSQLVLDFSYSEMVNYIHGQLSSLLCGAQIGDIRYDTSEALLQAVTLNAHGNPATVCFRCKGFEAEAVYRDEETGAQYEGAGLMRAGIPMPQPGGEYRAWTLHLKKVGEKNEEK